MIWHLAIETSGREGSLALLQGDQPVREVNLSVDQRTTASFAPALEELLGQIPVGDPPLSLVSVSVGPGSFTGLRIGVTAAKTLCFALKSDLIAVDSLAVVCEQQRLVWRQLPAAEKRSDDKANVDKVAVCTNAYRGQLFLRIENLSQNFDHADAPSQIVDQSVWDDLQKSSQIYCVGRRPVEDSAPAGNQPEYGFTADRWPRPMASTLGRLGWMMYRSGKRDNFWSLVPRYLRKSAAEEKADEKVIR